MCASPNRKTPSFTARSARTTFTARSARTRRSLSVLGLLAAALMVAACSDNTRTGSTFCKRLQDELPGINQPMESQSDVRSMVSRYKRLLDVTPLTIEDDFRALVKLLELAADSNPNDPESLQEVADAAYAANTSALQVSEWVYDTCAVDFATGMNVAPPRTPPPSTIPTEAPTDSIPVDVAPDTSAPSAP